MTSALINIGIGFLLGVYVGNKAIRTKINETVGKLFNSLTKKKEEKSDKKGLRTDSQDYS